MTLAVCECCGNEAVTDCAECHVPICDRCMDSLDPLDALCPACADEAYGEDE